MNLAHDPAASAMDRFPGLRVERHGAIEILVLNRPEILNALSVEMTGGLNAYFAGLAERTDVRVVILRAEGRAFCAGLDLKGWQREEGRTPARHGLRTQTAIGNIYRLMRACPQPIIAVAQGAASGGGLSLLLASDLRLATPTLRMNVAYIKIGLSGCDMGSSYFLPRLVGSALASEMLLTGRFIDAQRALRHGLVNDIVDEGAILDAAMGFANEMLALAPHGLRLTKQLLDINIDAPSLEAAMAAEDRQQILLSTTDDHQEAVRAFLEKRPPDFTDN